MVVEGPEGLRDFEVVEKSETHWINYGPPLRRQTHASFPATRREEARDKKAGR